MKLKDNFFKISKKKIESENIQYMITLVPEHFIYEAHFPDNPITPGVCIIQIIQELASEHLQTAFMLKNVARAKFLNILNPLENPTVNITLAILSEEGNYKVTANVYSGKTNFTQLNVILKPIE